MSTESTQSTTREAQTTTTSGGNELTACAAINSADTWLDLEVKVLELWESASSSVSQVGLLGDSSGVVKFVSWATSDVPQLEEGASYTLETVVTDEYDGQYSVNLNSETSVEEITGAAAKRERLAADISKAVALGTIDTADTWVDVQVKVDQLWEPSSDSIAQVGLLADESGTVKFVSWEKSDLPKLDEGEAYVLENVVTDEYEGRYSVKLNSESEITHLDGGVASVR